jgi:hypothetical protein
MNATNKHHQMTTKLKPHIKFQPTGDTSGKYPPLSWQQLSRVYPDLYYSLVYQFSQAAKRARA